MRPTNTPGFALTFEFSEFVETDPAQRCVPARDPDDGPALIIRGGDFALADVEFAEWHADPGIAETVSSCSITYTVQGTPHTVLYLMGEQDRLDGPRHRAWKEGRYVRV